MAGIGFELKKLLKKDGIGRLISGLTYSTLVTVGPTVIVIATIVILYILLGFTSVPYSQMELLSSTILYAFIFSLIVTAPFNGVLSRYIANKIFDEKYSDILPSYYTGLLLCLGLSAIAGIPIVIKLILVGGVDPFFAVISFCLFISLVINFFSMTYLSATKDYKIIAMFYLIGMVITFGLALLFKRYGLSTIESILYGLFIGFFIIDIFEYGYIKKYLKNNSKNYKECLRYLAKYKKILICNLCYFLGFYAHIFVFWTHPSHIIVAKTYVSMQSYDMATCLAMFTSISTMIIFTVMAETKFHNKYQEYNNAVIGNTLEYINKTKKSMFRLLVQQVRYIANIQAIITSILFLLARVILPNLGFGGSVMDIYSLLVVGYFVIFMMYCNVIYLFYFDDTNGAMYSTIIFLIVVVAGSLFSVRLSQELYGLGVLIGACAGWTFSFFRLRYIEKHFDRHIFGNVNIINKIVGEEPNSTVYIGSNYKIDKKNKLVKVDKQI